MHLPPEGTRINLAGQFGTVRFAGNVDNTTGVWLGIEWDDPSRGKHDGIKDSKRYFSCRIQNAGSFIRPSAVNLSYGRSFLDALVAKYVEPPHGSESQEKVLLGSSNGTIVVEAVRLDKIRGNLARLERLKEVSLNDEHVARGDALGTIRSTCPNIIGLDLSASLLPSWDTVASIASELPNLQRLALNRNRLQPTTNPAFMQSAFMTLTQVQLNGTMMTWAEMQEVTAYMPGLHLVEMGYNGLVRLQSSTLSAPLNTTIEVLNLDSNLCSEWGHIYNSLLHYRSLERIILTSNGIGTIPFPDSVQQLSHSLKHISLSFNKLNAWNDVDALSLWCPGLESLTLSGNPLMSELGRHSRPFTIARIPSLLVLDGAAIATKERTDCELFYLSDVMQHGPGNEEERIRAHPQWQTLCASMSNVKLLASFKRRA
ncbi:CAP Gly-rich domain-containing protein [Collybia nuda]|uniref:CAP Gly-rich domain-containing protein n=1 Tax=Collybia nuda TaxID=64659 RepID=A0A9P6CK54_9AGAR|nr:CAP Gly-rich domain-containing protein [Collybia nuda]